MPAAYEFVSIGELARHASICGPGSPGAAALAEFSRLLDGGRTPVCLQALDGTYPARLLVFDAARPPADLPETLRARCVELAERVRRRMAAHVRKTQQQI